MILGTYIAFDINLSFFDVIIFSVLFWAIYRGYTRGSIIHSVALLVLVAGTVIAAKFSYFIYDFFTMRAKIPLVNLPVIIFSILFILAVLGSHFVANKVIGNIGKTPKGMTNRVLGIFVNLVKYLFMISIVLIFIFKLDASFNFIHKKEKERTNFFYPVLSIAPSAFRVLRFPEIDPVPLSKPKEFEKYKRNEQTTTGGGVNIDDF